ncbi:hypothetical protein C5167_014747 [Papaver somniferum]|uniref:Antistasin-like domain-containing protein n=1 Tax=Papaver somniferum TaxID=3469 RepID=A0A4Y7J627_PAPSO|nr:hypothetical protein C5167_014747 [Papaver somniferum]
MGKNIRMILGKCVPPKHCRLICPNGFIKDNDGCKTCTCSPECPRIRCRMYCPEYLKDENLCETCECV